jgi:hypothetical protein
MFDQDTQRMVRVFQKVFHLSYVERDQVKYVKRYAEHIEWAGRLFEFLYLAKGDKRSPLGWRPTPLLLDIMNKRAERKTKPSRKPIPRLNKLIVDLLDDAVIADERREIGSSILRLGFEALKELGLVRWDQDGHLGATPRLLQLFADAYYKHLADEMEKNDYPYWVVRRRLGVSLYDLVPPRPLVTIGGLKGRYSAEYHSAEWPFVSMSVQKSLAAQEKQWELGSYPHCESHLVGIDERASRSTENRDPAECLSAGSFLLPKKGAYLVLRLLPFRYLEKEGHLHHDNYLFRCRDGHV